jgi:hypothetical protein
MNFLSSVFTFIKINLVAGVLAAEPIKNPVISPEEGEYSNVEVNPLGDYLARLWWTIVLLGALALLIFLIWGGIDLLTSEGDKEKYKNAQNKITHALMGMALLAASFAIMQVVATVFKVDLLKLEWPTASPGV